MQSAKKNITRLVKEYIRDNPEEWENFKDHMQMVRALAKDEEFGTLDGTRYTRALYEMPETLQLMFIKELTEDEMLWLKTGGLNGKEGGRWFAKNFSDFCIPDKV